MKFRITDAKTFAVEFESNSLKAFISKCSEALMGMNAEKRRFIETQFLDDDGVWRLPLKSGVPFKFTPKFNSDYEEAYELMLSSADHISRLTSVAEFVTDKT